MSHYEATGSTTAISLARNSADLLVREFTTGSPQKTDGHEEIEIALLRLYQVTNHLPYLNLASAFLERRGRIQMIAPYVISQNHRAGKRKQKVAKDRLAFHEVHPEYLQYKQPGDNFNRAPRNSRLRWVASALSGKYFQMHAPIRDQTIPVGHAVRFGYLETATAMLARITGDHSLLPSMEQAWERMVTRLMFMTGGLGSIPGLEGFGRDDELDPLYAYAETCAALASIFWNWEMGLILRQAKYSDLIEWQLYNAAIVGMGLLGKDYLYNNPLACLGGVTRRSWFSVPCCPSNLSRTLASLDKYIFSHDDQNLWVHQYISGNALLGDKWAVNMESFPALGREC